MHFHVLDRSSYHQDRDLPIAHQLFPIAFHSFYVFGWNNLSVLAESLVVGDLERATKAKHHLPTADEGVMNEDEFLAGKDTHPSSFQCLK